MVGIMQTLFLCVMSYVAVGAALFAHPIGRAVPDDFDLAGQVRVFRMTLPEVLGWPLALWRMVSSSD